MPKSGKKKKKHNTEYVCLDNLSNKIQEKIPDRRISVEISKIMLTMYNAHHNVNDRILLSLTLRKTH